MFELTEVQEFLLFFSEGIVIGFIYDIFRSVRKNFKTRDNLVFIEDSIFLLLSSLIFIVSIVYFCNGEVRFYIFLGLFSGIFIYSLTIGKKCVIILTNVVKIIKNILIFLLKILKRLVKQFNL